MATDPISAAALIRGLMAGRGLTQKAVASELGISDRMVRKVLGGVSEGANYTPRLNALVNTGRAAGTPVQRRQTKSGGLARVRAPGGGTRVPAPVEPPPRPARGAFGSTEREYLPAGGSAQTITAPKSDGIGREDARRAILEAVKAAGPNAHIMFKVADSTGATGTIGSKGGYKGSKASAGMRGEGDDPFAWLEAELASAGPGNKGGRSSGASVGTITRVSVIVL